MNLWHLVIMREIKIDAFAEGHFYNISIFSARPGCPTLQVYVRVRLAIYVIYDGGIMVK